MPKRKFDFFFGLACIAAALLILFVIPETAPHDVKGGRLNAGYFYLGMRALLGDYLARYFAALPFGLLAWYLLRSAWKQPSPSGANSDKDEPLRPSRKIRKARIRSTRNERRSGKS